MYQNEHRNKPCLATGLVALMAKDCAKLLLLAVALAAGATSASASTASEIAPGSIIKKGAPQPIPAWIEAQSLDGLTYYLGDPTNQANGKQQMGRDKYLRVEFQEAESSDYIVGNYDFEQGKFEKAAEMYKKATASAKWFWEIEDSYLRSAECRYRLGHFDEAIALLKEYSTRYPNSVHVIDVIARSGACKQGKGDLDGAIADFTQLVQHADDWGGTAKRDGLLGLSKVYQQQKQYAKVIDMMLPYFNTLRNAVLTTQGTPTIAASAQIEEVALVGESVSDAQSALGKITDAIDTLKKIYLLPASTETQARLHLASARLLMKDNSTAGNISAFDQALLAATVGGDPETQAAAVKLARDLVVQHLDVDKAISDKDRKEYRGYISSL